MKNRIYSGLLLWASLLCLPLWGDELSPRMVLVIDDLGPNLMQGQAILALPGPVTYAVLPFTPHATHLARLAELRGKEIILHAPMANLANLPLGPGGLYPHLSEQEFKQVLNSNLDSLPRARGLNNHMGSLLTQQEQPMRWVMEVARERDLFYLDSRTTAETLAADIAREERVPVLERKVFLDHEVTADYVEQQFLHAIEVAKTEGSVVVIGHPYPVTVEYLKQGLPLLDELGIQLVSASAFLMQEADLQRLHQYQQRKLQTAQRVDEPSAGSSSILRVTPE
ncbi:divergent polysaccharide deacetylase family protein [Nitrincola sp. A-D6]|uniref:divergent polysaccharide deacetylase family protein n=1 Tax=Nitrincola sp. A-D6 TaxID=1545442 RepID=UPI001186B2C0|nr:divergent polysaccharide deacetylase family protein [Nitrincola sp. A-D6]